MSRDSESGSFSHTGSLGWIWKESNNRDNIGALCEFFFLFLFAFTAPYGTGVCTTGSSRSNLDNGLLTQGLKQSLHRLNTGNLAGLIRVWGCSASEKSA